MLLVFSLLVVDFNLPLPLCTSSSKLFIHLLMFFFIPQLISTEHFFSCLTEMCKVGDCTHVYCYSSKNLIHVVENFHSV